MTPSRGDEGADSDLKELTSLREIRTPLAWEVLLIAASLPEFHERAPDLGVMDFISPLQAAGASYASLPAVATAELGRKIQDIRVSIKASAGAPTLRAIDAWVDDQFVYFLDPTVHYLNAIESFVGARPGIVAPHAFEVPAWVQEQMLRDFQRQQWRRMFAGVDRSGGPNRRVTWESVASSLEATVARRAFRSFWRDMTRRLTPAELHKFRDWVAAALTIGSSTFEVPMPLDDGSFANRIS